MTTLTQFIGNISEIVTAITTMFTSVMIIFMEPPLSIFIGIALFLTLLLVIQHAMYISRSKQYNIAAKNRRLLSEYIEETRRDREKFKKEHWK